MSEDILKLCRDMGRLQISDGQTPQGDMSAIVSQLCVDMENLNISARQEESMEWTTSDYRRKTGHIKQATHQAGRQEESMEWTTSDYRRKTGHIKQATHQAGRQEEEMDWTTSAYEHRKHQTSRSKRKKRNGPYTIPSKRKF